MKKSISCKFLQAVFINTKGGQGKDFSRGIHEVTEDIQQTPDFITFVKAGWIVDAQAEVTGKPLDVNARAKKLVDKALGKPADVQAPPAAPPKVEEASKDAEPTPALSKEEQAKADEAELDKMVADEEAAKESKKKKHGKG